MSISKRWILRIVLTAVCAFAVGFILYNSLQPAVQSAQQSGRVVALIQRAAAVVAPNSSIANATGDAYQRLHEAVRTLAHFSEYAFLGVLGGWCCLSYTMKKSFYGIPMAALTAVAGLDEWLQTFASGRAAQWSDIWVDICGGGMGLLIAALSVYIAIKIVKRRKHETR